MNMLNFRSIANGRGELGAVETKVFTPVKKVPITAWILVWRRILTQTINLTDVTHFL